MRLRLAFLVLALAGDLSAQPAPAIDALLGRPVTSVTVEADGRAVATADVIGLLETRVGTPLSMAEVRESVFHLARVGRFDQVDVDGRPDGAGVAVTYRLVLARRMTRVAFRGDLGVSSGALRDVLAGRYLGTPTLEKLRDAERALTTFYRARGYFGAQVSVSVDDVPDPLRSQLVCAVQAGTRSRIGRLDVSPGGTTSRAEILARLDLREGDPWDAPRLEQRAQRFVDALKADGFYEARVTWDVQPSDAGALVDVTVEADPGRRVELVFEGSDLEDQRLRELVPVEREGSVDEDLLEDSKRRIERWMHDQGYWRGSVDYERAEVGDRLRITFRVTKGALYEVAQVAIEGVGAAREPEVQVLVRLRAGARFVEETLQADAARIEQYYQMRGFVAARAETRVEEVPGRAGANAARLVRPRLIVSEGQRTEVGAIRINGVQAIPEAELRGLMALKPGAAFYAPQLIADRNAVQARYLDRGYREARVDAIPSASSRPEVLDVSYEVTEGQRHVVGHVLVAGNTRTSERTIRRELGLVPGAPLGAGDLAEGQRRLSALGLFRRVRVEELPWPGRAASDVAVTVEEAPATNIGYGFGLEGGRRLVRDPDQADAAVEKFEISPRGFFEVGRRNLLGKNRSLNLFTRFSLRDRGGSETSATPDDSAFYEYRVVGTYREPRAFGTTADGQVTGFLEQGVRTSFNFGRRGVTAELARRLGPTFLLVGRYGLGNTQLYDERYNAEEKPLIDRLFPQVRLSTFSGVLVQDARDDPLDPGRGYVLNMQADLSGRAIGSEVGFVKSFAQGFVYRRIPGTRGLTFAGGARLGLAKAFGAQVTVGDTGESVVVDVEDLPASERFYAGGSTTVRGYATDRLGDDATIDSDGFPQGGNALVIFNAEIRFPVWRSLGGVTFVDAGNVFARTGDLDLGRIKVSLGGGVRYKSPIGPIRVDFGIKTDPRTFQNGQTEQRWEVHISLGQAF